MKDRITRRDFLNGTQIAIGASLASPWTNAFGTTPGDFALPADYYPPTRTGMRGSHDGAWETMHARVAGQVFAPQSIDENYDLVVVGGGISGLSAAHFYRKAHPGARVLVLDNHDDFGGHAKRNEFEHNGKTRIGYGGTESIDTPSAYSEVAQNLLKELGIALPRFYDYFDQSLYASKGMGQAIVFDEQGFGEHKTVTGYGSLPWQEFVAKTPMNPTARADLVRAFTDEKDYLPTLSRDEKRALLSKTSYYDFLKDYVKVDQQVLELYRRWGMSFWCVGIDEIPAIAVQAYDDGGGMPGLKYTMPRVGYRGNEPYIFHFPDGNASIARLLVRALIPKAVPGSTMEDVVTAKVRYALLDRPDAAVNIRLNSTAVNVVHTDREKRVAITYVRDGKTHTVAAKHCVMACYNSAIPYLCPELPKPQVTGLQYNVKVPLTYTKILVNNWRAFAELGASYVYYTNALYKQVELDYPVSMGRYQFGSNPDEPMVLHMCHVPYFENISGPDQWRAGRRQMLGRSFASFEQNVYAQLGQALAGTPFDPQRDIEAITVNRWAHGYAYSPDLLWEPQWPDERSKPWVIGRQPFGRITIANSDASAAANTDAAIYNAHRAVAELP